MANALYDNGRNGFLTGAINWLSDSIKVMLVAITGGSPYAVNLATHQYVSDVTAGAIVARSAALSGKSAAAGVANASNITLTAVTGSTVGAIIIYKDTGSDATSPLIAYLDTVQGGGALSVTPNGGDITVQWDTGANKVFKL